MSREQRDDLAARIRQAMDRSPEAELTDEQIARAAVILGLKQGDLESAGLG